MEKSIKYWQELSKKIKSPSETKNKRPDTSAIEAEFISKYLKPDMELLDLGSGTGLIINKIVGKVKKIIAVEKFEEFSRFIVENPSLLVINADLNGFKIRKNFDIITCLGVAQYFSKNEILEIYNNIYSMLKKDGILILRNHCGIYEDVIVDGFSEELGTEYYAEYRFIKNELKMLSKIGFHNIEIYDILPDTINVWENTRHYFIVCQK